MIHRHKNVIMPAPVAVPMAFSVQYELRERRRWIIGAAALTLGLVGALMLAGCPSDPVNPTYPYICTNGTPVAGTSAVAGTDRCASCADRYGLTPAARCAPIGSAIAVGVGNEFYGGEDLPSGLAAIDNTLYMVGARNDWLYMVDAADGTATRVGFSGAFGVGEYRPSGLAAIGNTLYMVGHYTDRLYTLDPNTGAATPVGTATQFGIGEHIVLGLAAIGDTLYMVGDTTDRLYTLDPNTGAATPVGTATQFGVGEDTPNGLAAIGNTLYLVGGDIDLLYTLDIDTTSSTAGRATRVGNTAAGFGVFEGTPSGLAAIGNTLYMVGDTTDRLYTLDIDTMSSTAGAATRVGSAETFASGNNESYPHDLAAIGDTLYMVGATTDRLYTLDATTGAATPVGTATQFGVGELDPRGLAAIDNDLYMVGASNRRLYMLDPETGIATRVGTSTFTASGSVGEYSPRGLAAIDDRLYMAGAFNDWLYTLDTTTGVATRVGSSSDFGSRANETEPAGLAAIGDTLYMIGTIHGGRPHGGRLYTLDTTTGVATQVGSQVAFGVGDTNPLGLAVIGSTLYMSGQNTRLYTLVLP